MIDWLILIGAIFLPIILILGALTIFASVTVVSSIFFLLIGFAISGFIIFIGMMIAPIQPKIGRYLAYAGVIGIMILLLIIEGSIIGLSGVNLGYKFVKGGYNLWTECKQPIESLDVFLSCALTGHQPLPTGVKDIWGWLGIYGFYIFGLLVPLFILSALFADFVETSGIVSNRTYQKIIGFGLGFMAYRGFIVTRLIYILDIGSVGIALIALNFIWLGGILGYIKRSFAQFKLLEADIDLSTDIEKVKRYLVSIANKWESVEMVAANLSDPIIFRDLQLVVGNTMAELLRDKSRNIKDSNDIPKFRDEFKKAIMKS
ncbi:MAG: hypothetical protein KQA41_02155 [Candidatus Aenigmarchaeota archaeon]|nr:hypothetical protein [Candidatus Aenigmarchaeota archaeon]MBU5689004.1 hypothetical protein [Candidatus Aenigmarchaeota archaeon]